MKTLKVFFVALLVTLIISACGSPGTTAFHSTATELSVQGSMAAQIPEALIQFFNGVVIALFTAGFVWGFERFGLDLRQYAIPLAGSVSTWIVMEFQGYLNTVPNTQDFYWNLLFRILLALVPAAGLLRIFSRQPATLLETSTNRAK